MSDCNHPKTCEEWENKLAEIRRLQENITTLTQALEKAKDFIQECRNKFNQIKDEHNDCDVPDSEHEMFKIAEEGNKICYEHLSAITKALEGRWIMTHQERIEG